MLVLYQLELSPIFQRSPNTTVFIIFFYIPLIINIGLRIWRGKSKISVPDGIIFRKHGNITAIFLISTILEILLAKNLPLVSLLGIGPYINYVNYGIPGLHGMVNSMHMFLATIFMLKFLYIKEKKYLILFIITIMWSACLVSRQLTLSIVFQNFFVYIFVVHKGKLTSKFFVRFVIITLLVFVLFTSLGNLRSGHDGLAGALQFEVEANFFSVGFYWVYAYLISPIHNFLNNLLDLKTLFPLNTFISIFPSSVRSVFSPLLLQPLWLEYEIFNVATWFPVFVADFGSIGISLAAVLLSVSQLKIFSKHFYSSLPAYVFLCHAALFSVFANFYFSLPFILYWALTYRYLKKCLA